MSAHAATVKQARDAREGAPASDRRENAAENVCGQAADASTVLLLL